MRQRVRAGPSRGIGWRGEVARNFDHQEAAQLHHEFEELRASHGVYLNPLVPTLEV